MDWTAPFGDTEEQVRTALLEQAEQLINLWRIDLRAEGASLVKPHGSTQGKGRTAHHFGTALGPQSKSGTERCRWAPDFNWWVVQGLNL